MKIIDYIKGDKRGRTSNELERTALHDQFLNDALQGYEAARHENHFDRLMSLNAYVVRRSKRSKHRTLYRTFRYVGGIAAVIAVGFGVWTLLPTSTKDETVMQQAMLAELEGATRQVGTTQQLLAQAQQSDAYRDVWSYESAEGFFADQPGSEADAITRLPAEFTENATDEVIPVQDQEVATTNSVQIPTINNLDTITNPAFVSYFEARRKVKGVSGRVVMEFRVGDSGRPSRIQVLSAPNQEVGREAIELLISGPAWQPSGEYRIRTVLQIN